MKLGAEMLDSTINKEQRISRLFRMHAAKQEPLDEAHAGDIVACVGLTETRTGDTLCDPEHPITLSSSASTRRLPRRSSPAWASSTSRSSSTA